MPCYAYTLDKGEIEDKVEMYSVCRFLKTIVVADLRESL